MKSNHSAKLVIGVVIIVIMFLAKATGCVAQSFIGQPYTVASKFNKIVDSTVHIQNVHDSSTSEKAIYFVCDLKDRALTITYKLESDLVSGITLYGYEADVKKIFQKFNPDAGKQFVLFENSRIYIQKVSDKTWCLMVVKKV